LEEYSSRCDTRANWWHQPVQVQVWNRRETKNACKLAGMPDCNFFSRAQQFEVQVPQLMFIVDHITTGASVLIKTEEYSTSYQHLLQIKSLPNKMENGKDDSNLVNVLSTVIPGIIVCILIVGFFYMMYHFRHRYAQFHQTRIVAVLRKQESLQLEKRVKYVSKMLTKRVSCKLCFRLFDIEKDALFFTSLWLCFIVCIMLITLG